MKKLLFGLIFILQVFVGSNVLNGYYYCQCNLKENYGGTNKKICTVYTSVNTYLGYHTPRSWCSYKCSSSYDAIGEIIHIGSDVVKSVSDDESNYGKRCSNARTITNFFTHCNDNTNCKKGYYCYKKNLFTKSVCKKQIEFGSKCEVGGNARQCAEGQKCSYGKCTSIDAGSDSYYGDSNRETRDILGK